MAKSKMLMVCSMHEKLDDDLTGHDVGRSPERLLLPPYSRRALSAHLELELDDEAAGACETS